MYKELDLNNYSRIFIVGDIHGCFDMLQYALKDVGFSDSDFLLCLGDLIDRGDKNLEVLNFVLESDNVFSIKGNHEDIACNYFSNISVDYLKKYWNNQGGKWHEDYDLDYLVNLFKIVDTFPVALKVIFNNKSIGLAHADCILDDWNDIKKYINEDSDGDNQKKLMWSRVKFEKVINHEYFKSLENIKEIKPNKNFIIKNIDNVFYGHSILGEHLTLGNQNWIDTGAFMDLGFEDHGLTLVEFSELDKEPIFHRFGIDLYNLNRFERFL